MIPQNKLAIFAPHTVPDKTGLKGNPVQVGNYPRSCKFRPLPAPRRKSVKRQGFDFFCHLHPIPPLSEDKERWEGHSKPEQVRRPAACHRFVAFGRKAKDSVAATLRNNSPFSQKAIRSLTNHFKPSGLKTLTGLQKRTQ